MVMWRAPYEAGPCVHIAKLIWGFLKNIADNSYKMFIWIRIYVVVHIFPQSSINQSLFIWPNIKHCTCTFTVDATLLCFIHDTLFFSYDLLNFAPSVLHYTVLSGQPRITADLLVLNGGEGVFKRVCCGHCNNNKLTTVWREKKLKLTK